MSVQISIHESDPDVRILHVPDGRPFITVQLDESVTVILPGIGEAPQTYARRLAAKLNEAADTITREMGVVGRGGIAGLDEGAAVQ
jgi:hypothetical protein